MNAPTMWAARSHVGKVRAMNEDSAYAGRWLYAIADGDRDPQPGGSRG